MKKLLLLLLSISICVNLFAQGKIYTKKMLLADFPNKITKVIINPEFYPSSILEAEMAAKWILSPYEFCTLEDYNHLKNDNSYYFLSFEKNEGIIFLSLNKGGKVDESDNFKKGFKLISLAFCGDGSDGEIESSYLGSLVDIIQDYTSAAIENDNIAYAGTAYFKDKKLNGIHLYFKDYTKALINNEKDSAVAICISPSNGDFAYKMIISTDTHEMLYYRQIKNNNINSFTEKEKQYFKRKNGIIVE